MFKNCFVIIFALVIGGCVSSGSTLGSGTYPTGQPVCLSDCNEIPSAIEKYTKTHDLTTEEDEIDYLLYRIRSSNDKFVRNGSESNSVAAAEFLRWKISWYERRYSKKIDDDEKFVAWITKGSEKTGKPYVIILPDGSKHNLQYVMFNELNHLEAYEGDTPEMPTLNA